MLHNFMSQQLIMKKSKPLTFVATSSYTYCTVNVTDTFFFFEGCAYKSSVMHLVRGSYSL